MSKRNCLTQPSFGGWEKKYICLSFVCSDPSKCVQSSVLCSLQQPQGLFQIVNGGWNVLVVQG